MSACIMQLEQDPITGLSYAKPHSHRKDLPNNLLLKARLGKAFGLNRQDKKKQVFVLLEF